ncbi:MAG: sensor histidine kinase [Microbacterium sp.]|uniref:sensor histidine kinase n=1 Tax=Microbacterium sp. TaxID=51671 RepID=UPI0039E24383
MTTLRGDREAAMSARGWGVALLAAVVVCGVAAALGAGGDWRAPTLSLVLFAGYAAVFLASGRGVPAGSLAAWGWAIATIVFTGAATAIAASNAVFQFWAFPALWMLVPGPRRGLPLSLALAAAVFGGFLISTGTGSGAVITALLTQGISFGFAAAMGLWQSSLYAHGRQRDRLLTELTAAHEEVAVLHRDAGVTAERERLARELHDTLAQSLTAAVLLVQRARRELAGSRLTDAGLEGVEDAVRTALTETRTLVAGSAPLELAGSGLAGALEILAARFRREAGVEVEVQVALARPLDRETEVVLLRCAQEGFANVRKHAEARRILVSLISDEAGATLTVRNDGHGFDPGVEPAGYGLNGLRARLGLVGGSLKLDGTKGAVELRARVPAGAAT